MSGDLLAKGRAIVASIEAVGVKATLDPRKVNAPCALVVPPDLERVVASGVYAAWQVHLIAPGAADLDAVAWLLSHLTEVYEAVGAFTAEFGNLSLSPDSDPLPAYTLTIVNQPV